MFYIAMYLLVSGLTCLLIIAYSIHYYSKLSPEELARRDRDENGPLPTTEEVEQTLLKTTFHPLNFN